MTENWSHVVFVLCPGIHIEGRKPRFLMLCDLSSVSFKRMRRDFDLWRAEASAVSFIASINGSVEHLAEVYNLLVALCNMHAFQSAFIGVCAAV